MSALPGRRSILLFLLTCGVGLGHAADAPSPKKVLFFTKSSGYEHSVIKETNGKPSYAAAILNELGPKYGIAFTMSKDGSLFTPQYLAQFDAIFFFTTGDLLAPGGDGQPGMTPAGKAALLAAIEGGKGFIGAHSATDTFHAGETVSTDQNAVLPQRYRNLGDKADPYTRMIGAEFIVHGAQQTGRMLVIDPNFPGLTNKGDHFDLKEEWYSLKDFAPDMHVLLVQDTAHMGDPDHTGGNSSYVRPPYPSTWARMQGKGRVFYTAMGHREETWSNPAFQQILFGGISWAAGITPAAIPPNLAVAAPGATTLPPTLPAKK